MKKVQRVLKIFTFVLLLLTSSSILIVCSSISKPKNKKINGFNISGPRNKLAIDDFKPMAELGSNYISVIPYAFTDTASNFSFDHDRQWWGEKTEGVTSSIEMARECGLKIMLKPHLWVKNQGWAGDFIPNSWEAWETNYFDYIIHYAKIARDTKVDILCIGTEIKQSVKMRPKFWENLIDSVKTIYPGKITYASNWDNYTNVTFWDKIDFIGIDAYFPLSNKKTPEVDELIKAWKAKKKEFKMFSEKYNKKILFTEYGFQSIDYSSKGHWEVNKDTLEINLQGQQNNFEALYKSLWQEDYFAGGFIWKWHFRSSTKISRLEKDFTPQSKPALKTIKKWFY